MRRVFADSFYFFALVSEDDAHHAAAVEFAAAFRGRIVTTSFVLLEVGDGLARPFSRSAFLPLLGSLRNKRDVTIEPCSQELLDLGIELYSKRADKAWSLTDCISFVVMQREQIREALTADHHFEQAGFVPLFR